MISLHVVGRKKSGKTSLVVRLIPLLQASGLRVGTVKHSSHPFSLDREGSDSWQHQKAGAAATLLITASSVSLHHAAPGSGAETDALVERYLGALDLVIIEGWAARPGPKIEVLPADAEGRVREPRVREPGELLAVVLSPGVSAAAETLTQWGLRLRVRGEAPRPSGEPGTGAVPCFLWEDAQGVAELVLRWYEQRNRA